MNKVNLTNTNKLSNQNQVKNFGSNLPILQNDYKHHTLLQEVITNKISYEMSKEDKQLLINKVNSLDTPISLVFTVDETSGKNIIQFIDSENNQVIKQIPTEEMIKIIKQIDLFLSKNTKILPLGTLLNERI